MTQPIKIFDMDGVELGTHPFHGQPMFGDVLLMVMNERLTLVTIVSRRWTDEGELQLIVTPYE